MGIEKEIHELIIAYLRGDISTEEQVVLREWLARDRRHGELLEELKSKDVLRRDAVIYASFDTAGRWKRLRQEMNKVPRGKSRLLLRWVAVAAVFAVAVLTGVFYWQAYDSPGVEVAESVRILPGSSHAVLITESGKQVSLLGMKDTTLVFAGNERVEISEDGRLKYHLTTASTVPEWHTLKIPRGGEFQITLDDGTEVWLNSDTELRYPSHFVGTERRVQLTGEAYFKVAPNEEAPFIVDTRGMDVKVLGTSFNLSVYPDEKVCHATLEKGRIQVNDKENGKQVVLSSGEQAVLSGEMLEVRTVNTRLYSSWIKGRFSFASEDLEGVMRTLSRWYNVEYVFSNVSMKDKRFTGTIPKYTEISQALKMIEMTSDVQFKIRGTTIIIQ